MGRRTAPASRRFRAGDQIHCIVFVLYRLQVPFNPYCGSYCTRTVPVQYPKTLKIDFQILDSIEILRSQPITGAQEVPGLALRLFVFLETVSISSVARTAHSWLWREKLVNCSGSRFDAW